MGERGEGEGEGVGREGVMIDDRKERGKRRSRRKRRMEADDEYRRKEREGDCGEGKRRKVIFEETRGRNEKEKEGGTRNEEGRK